MNQLNLEGVVTAVVTPFHEDESLDLESLRSYVKYVLDVPGVNGILTCGYSGEVTSLNRDEELRVVGAVAEAVNGRVPILAGVEPTSTKDTIEFGKQLRDAGATVLQINTPFYNILRRGFIHNEDVVVKFFSDLAEGLDMPMTVFQYPVSSGVNYPASTIGRLAEIDQVIGIKEATSMETYEADYKAVRGKTAVFADNNTYTLFGMMQYGTQGSMVGIGNVGVPLWAELYRLVSTGDNTAAAIHMNSKIVPLINTFSRDLGQTKFSFIARVKEALVQMGHIPNGTTRAPEPAVTQADKEEVHSTLVEVGLLAK